ncbi:LuxR family transcriptional regulator [Microbispora amethystogenes]|uniref:LuxR family transcriptional regulator n=2 Tax=Microbispora amethystogenes TaxID=1427754 RepID=A0ABQ4F9A5_9ACTN|nr:LuxR family transcriptional regulator [Microbispora amethystogenes]
MGVMTAGGPGGASFVGRGPELAEIGRLLGTARVVTVVGVGGVGKTRLALRAAEEAGGSFPGGVRLAELAALEDPALLAHAVGDALPVAGHSARPPLEAVIDRLRGGPALVVLDNCEHLLPGCAPFVDTLVRALPELRVLATGRRPLGLPGERVVELAPLPEPDAVRLFADRAAAVAPGFEGAGPETAEICRRLGGLPLAIEMTAVRLRDLTARQVLRGLDDRLRHGRVPQALFEWSHDLCTPGERLLWRRVSVFSGGVDLEAAEHVCAGDGIAREDVPALVAGLVGASVLRPCEHDGVVRYHLQDTVRAFGRALLAASGEEAALRRRHRDYYRRITSRAWAEPSGVAQRSWTERLRREHADLRTALDWSLREPGGAETALTMIAELLYHWSGHHLPEGAGWFDRGLAAQTDPGEARAHGLWAGAWIALLAGDRATATARLEEAGTIAGRLGLRGIRGHVAFLTGMTAVRGGDLRTGMRWYEEAVRAHRAVGDPVGLALALSRLALAHASLGRAAARDLAEECVALCDLYGEGRHRAYALLALSISAWRRGDTRAAVEHGDESLRHSALLDDRLGLGVNLEARAWFAAGARDHERAARLLGAADAVWAAAGSRMGEFGYLSRFRDACVAAVRTGLGEAAFRATLARGAAMPPGEAVAYALTDRLPAAQAPGKIGPLTRRETEIARLVAEGLSNKDIAGRLVISQRTAEGHIEHILDKLGFSSRVQVAAWVNGRTAV